MRRPFDEGRERTHGGTGPPVEVGEGVVGSEGETGKESARAVDE